MAEEPTLPRFPSVSWDSETQTFNNTRKRARSRVEAPAQLFSNSSDPAVFSSDDDPSLENYVQGTRHRKKRYVGSWYQQQSVASSDSALGEEIRAPPPRPKGKRTFERTVDSGVWMGSDESTDLDFDDADVGQFLLPPPSRLPQLNVPRQSAATISEAERAARARISAAIEVGNENIDLSSLSLEHLSNATISPLSEFECIPTVEPGVPFEHRDPALKIFLSTNPLPRAPGALFNLEYLTVLSLRNTKITELPPALGRLRNLKSLNLSLNRLRWLPGELLGLMMYPSKLENLLIHPNPFYQPASDPEPLPELDDCKYDSPEDILTLYPEMGNGDDSLRLWLDRRDGLRKNAGNHPITSGKSSCWQGRILARSRVQFSDSRGLVMSKFELPNRTRDAGGANPSERLLLKIETEDLTLPPSTPSTLVRGGSGKASGVSSLLEVALKACSRTSQLPVLPSYLPDDAPSHLPELLRRIVSQGDANANSGQLPCSRCQKKAIVPVAQWIEWWEVANVTIGPGVWECDYLTGSEGEKAIPFIKRACSYRCLPEATEPGSRLPGTLRWSTKQAEGEEAS